MSDQLQSSAFGTATSNGTDGSSVHELPGQTGIANVRSLLFDDLRVRAGSGAALEGWRVEVLTLPLTRPSRRRVRVTLRGQLTVVRIGQARASLSCESRRVSMQVLGREQGESPEGALPTRDRSVDLSFTLPRSVAPRTAIRLLILLESSALSAESQADAVVDSVDIEAL